jgi:hypothetical protein
MATPKPPKDKSGDEARVINLDDYRSQDEPMRAPSGNHPAKRGLRKKEGK